LFVRVGMMLFAYIQQHYEFGYFQHLMFVLHWSM